MFGAAEDCPEVACKLLKWWPNLPLTPDNMHALELLYSTCNRETYSSAEREPPSRMMKRIVVIAEFLIIIRDFAKRKIILSNPAQPLVGAPNGPCRLHAHTTLRSPVVPPVQTRQAAAGNQDQTAGMAQ